LTVDEALRVATTAARQYLGDSSGEDLVTYELDPRENPDLLRKPAAVVIRGIQSADLGGTELICARERLRRALR
jgi:hypothetical protein